MSCRSILIVEDDEEIRWTLRELLEFEGYHVECASNGKQGLELLPQLATPCLILLDLMMPVMDGWEFLKLKKQDVQLAPIPVVVVTALGDQELEKYDAKKVIKKPIQFETLLKVVHEYCGMAIK